MLPMRVPSREAHPQGASIVAIAEESIGLIGLQPVPNIDFNGRDGGVPEW